MGRSKREDFRGKDLFGGQQDGFIPTLKSDPFSLL